MGRMSKNTVIFLILSIFFTLALSTFCEAADLSIGTYKLISQKRVTRTTFDYVFQANITNSSPTDLINVYANLTSLVPSMTVIDGSLSFGSVSAGASVRSSDTFTVRIDLTTTFNQNNLKWQINGDVPNTVADAGKVIGSGGGVVEVTDPNSPIYGVKIDIPTNALSSNEIISFSKTTLASTLPIGTVDAGQFVDLEPNGLQFDRNILVTIPYDDKDNDGLIDSSNIPETDIRVVTYDETEKKWKELTIVSQDTDKNTITFMTNHFSTYVSIATLNCTGPAIIFTIDGLKFAKLLTGGKIRNDLEPSYLQSVIRSMNLSNVNRACVFTYSGPGNSSDNRWNGDPYQTEHIMSDLKDQVKAYYDYAKKENKKFVLVTHSWGTILGMFALKYDEDVNPDLFITLSSPYGSINANSDGDELLINGFTQYMISETIHKNGTPPRVIDDFNFKWINYWAWGDLISGPINLTKDNLINARVDSAYDSVRDEPDTAFWHSVTTLDKHSMDNCTLLGVRLIEPDILWNAYGQTLFNEVKSEIQNSITYTELLPLGWLGAAAMSINNSGVVVGYGYAHGTEKGFIYSGGAYTELLPTGWQYAQPYSINNSGVVVGYGSDAHGTLKGFIYSGGAYTELLPPGWQYAYAYGINDSGVVVGYGEDANWYTKGFIYNGDAYTELLPPGWSDAWVHGTNNINDSGVVVGRGYDAYWTKKGFIYSGGAYTELPLPSGWLVADFDGINDSGVAVGYCVLDTHGTEKGFIYSGGAYTELLPLGWKWAYASGINDSGVVVGYGNAHETGKGFIYSGGAYTELLPLGWLGAAAMSINNSGVVVGYGYAHGTQKGFIYIP